MITPLGAEVAGTAVVPIASADVASQAAALLDTEAQIVRLTGDLSVRYIQSSRQQGFDGPMTGSESIVNASTLDEGLSDEDLQDVYAITWFDKSSEGYDEFVADMEAYQPGVEPTDLGNNAWLSVQVFADVTAEVDEISRASVMEAMNELSAYDTGGLTPPLDYTVEGTALGGSAPRLVASARSVYADVYRDGAWAPFSDDREPINANQVAARSLRAGAGWPLEPHPDVEGRGRCNQTLEQRRRIPWLTVVRSPRPARRRSGYVGASPRRAAAGSRARIARVSGPAHFPSRGLEGHD